MKKSIFSIQQWEEIVNQCEKIYKLENEIKEKYRDDEDFYNKRYEIRLEKLKSLLDEFNSFVIKNSSN